MSKVTRRKFLKAGTAAGIGMSIMSGVAFGENTKRPAVRRPILMNSHGGRNGDLGPRGLDSGWPILAAGGESLDAIEECTKTIELDPEDTSVGYGGLPNEDGIVQLDAQIADGKTYNYGAVGCLENIIHPASVARLVMERTDHIMLVGKGALEFAKMHGFTEMDLLTEKARKRWVAWKENLSDTDDYFPPKVIKDSNESPNPRDYDDYEEQDYLNDRIHGTVNVLGIDERGNIAGITSTSGLAWKLPGRCGDSPIIGAGLYVDNSIGGAGATGRGEEVIKTCGSFLLVEFMRQGMSPQQACEAVCQRIIDNYGGPDNINFNDKFVAINKDGDLGCANVRGRKGREPSLVYTTDGELKEYVGTNVIVL